jgi:hypothetical protein
MEVFGQVFHIGNKLGFYSLLSLLLLLLLYFMRPRPFKKVLPSLIFLEKSEKQLSMASFFRKFMKDWLLLLQFFLILLLCIAALDISTELFIRKMGGEVVLVIDASASSKARYEGKMLFDHYKEIARSRMGIANSIVLIKNSPQILAKQTNPLNAFASIASARPSDSLSNIWDAMMVSADLADPSSTIIVISDFADSNGKDILTAKKLLEAKGYNVELINPAKKNLSNVGIIKYTVKDNRATIDVKNFDDVAREVKIKNTDTSITINPYAVSQFTVRLEEGINLIEIETKDDFDVDDRIHIIVPRSSEGEVLFITSSRTSFMKTAFDSIRTLNVRRAEPPIISVGNQKIIVLENVNYNSLLPGTIESIRTQVEAGGLLIIAVQDDLDANKLGDLLPVELLKPHTQDVTVVNTRAVERFADYNFGMSSRYYEARPKEGIVVAEAYDKESSPVIVMAKYGLGNVLYYGIYDDNNPFKTSTQYPLFWINIIEYFLSEDEYGKVNLKVGDILYASEIRDSAGSIYRDYLQTELTGIYRLKEQVAVNLLSAEESDLNRGKALFSQEGFTEERAVRQQVELLPYLIALVILLSFLELVFLKRRGDL